MRRDIRNTYNSKSRVAWALVQKKLFEYVRSEEDTIDADFQLRPRYEDINSLRIRFEKDNGQVSVVFEILLRPAKPKGEFRFEESFPITNPEGPFEKGAFAAHVIQGFDEYINAEDAETRNFFGGLRKRKPEDAQQ